MPSLSEASLRHANYFRSVLGNINALYLSSGEAVKPSLEMLVRELANVLSARSWISANATDRQTQRFCVDFALAAPELLTIRVHARERIQIFDAAVTAARKLGDRQGESKILARLGDAYQHVDENLRAIQYCEQGLQVSTSFQDVGTRALCLLGPGEAYRVHNNYTQSRGYYEQAHLIFKQIADRRNEAACLQGLTEMHRFLDECAQAREFLLESLSIVRELATGEGKPTLYGAWPVSGFNWVSPRPRVHITRTRWPFCRFSANSGDVEVRSDGNIRRRSKSNLARPYIDRLSNLFVHLPLDLAIAVRQGARGTDSGAIALPSFRKWYQLSDPSGAGTLQPGIQVFAPALVEHLGEILCQRMDHTHIIAGLAQLFERSPLGIC